MKTHLPTTYFEGLSQAQHNTDIKLPKIDNLIRVLKLNSFSPSLNPCRYYVVDYVQKKYLYVDPSCNTYLGYPISYFLDAGPMFYTSLWHQDDFKTYNEEIFPGSLKFLKAYKCEKPGHLFINLNHRIKDRKGNKLILLQRSTIITSKEGLPLLSVGMVSNLNSHLTENRIIFSIESYEETPDFSPSKILVKRVYFHRQEDSLLTKREVEVLKWICEGLSSKQIADKMNISIYTINNHRQNMLEKTASKNTAELLKYATLQQIL